ncbi:MAG TPA: hypothetical protein VG917_05345 [Patescibacteria group bacterium]|nr:hypothetical protein [Patescibacteria group bacterium]
MAETKVKSGNNILVTGIVVVIVAAIAFFGGMQFQKMQKSGASQFATQNGQGGRGGAAGRFGGQFRGGANGARPIVGQILSSDDNSITVKMMDGSTKIVLVGANTKINKTDTGTKSDLKNGANVLVVGTSNSDGTVSGTSIQLNPQTMMFGTRPSGTPAAQQ